MKKKASQASMGTGSHIPSSNWVEVETKGAVKKNDTAESLEIRIGSCIVNVPARFDKTSLAEVCSVLLSL